MLCCSKWSGEEDKFLLEVVDVSCVCAVSGWRIILVCCEWLACHTCVLCCSKWSGEEDKFLLEVVDVSYGCAVSG